MPSAPPTLGRYQLLSRIGSGSFAEVFRARDLSLRRQVALKALLPALTASAEDQERFLSEARALAALRHPGIVTVYDVGEAEGRPYFAMELLAGETLATIIGREGPLPLDRVLALLTPLAEALDYLHAAGLVHRDVKDSNVMVGLDGRVTLLDFGIAFVGGVQRLTRTGVGLGTPECAAPEQILGEIVGPAADIYALGVLVYQLLSGRLPFTGEIAHVLYAQTHVPPRPLREYRHGLPDWVYATTALMLAKDASRRPASADEAVRMLKGRTRVPELVPGSQMPLRTLAPLPATPGSTPAVPAAVKMNRRRLAVSLGAVLVPLFVATLTFTIGRTGRRTVQPATANVQVATPVAPAPAIAAAVSATPIVTPSAPRLVATVPQTVTGVRTPFDITPGPDGALWFTETGGGGPNGGGVGRIETNGAISERPTPYLSPHGIAAAADGALWYVSSSGGVAVRLAPDGTQTRFASWPGRARADRITAGPDGALWFTEPAEHTVVRLALDGTVSQFSLPGARGEPSDIVSGPDGALWFTDQAGMIGRLTPQGTLHEFALTGAGQPTGLAVGPDGAIWFTEASAGRIGRITTSGTVTEFPLPDPSASPLYIVAGADGALWFSEGRANAIARISLQGAVHEFTLPVPGSLPQRLAVGPDGAIWFTEQGGDRIGRLMVTGQLTEFPLGQP